MSLARTHAVALVGIEGHLVEVQAHIAQGLPGFTLTGLPDTTLSEARDRVRAAILNTGEQFPQRRVTVGLLPAPLPKSGSAFDVAIAVAVLAASEVVPAAVAAPLVFLGELGLDGRVRPVRGVLPSVLAAVRAGRPRIVVAPENAVEAALVHGSEVVVVDSLRTLVAWLRGLPVALPEVPDAVPPPPPDGRDLRDVAGQASARRALEVAAAGGHSLHLLGPPGVGKTMLAERLPGLLPDLSTDDALEVSAVHSIAGVLPPGVGLLTRPPFSQPHHTASVPALVGGGSGLARPGAVSLAHRGVLFLDEAPEFPRGALDALRQPVESGEVVLHRAGGAARYPARFLLVLAANPCPCGFAGRVTAGDDCRCTPMARRRYLGRLSGPLLDRVDITVEIQPPSRADLVLDNPEAEPSAAVRARVVAARTCAAARLDGSPWRLWADVPGPELRRRWPLPPAAARPVWHAADCGVLSSRGVDRVFRLAWTLADLAGRDGPTVDDAREALALRVGSNAAGRPLGRPA